MICHFKNPSLANKITKVDTTNSPLFKMAADQTLKKNYPIFV